MAAAVFLSVTTELLPTGLLPAMSRDLKVTEGRLGLLVTAFALMVALFAAPLGMVFGRAPRRTVLVGALIGYGVCNAVTALSHSFPVTVGARVVGGLTHAVFWGMLGGYAGRIVSPDRVGRAVTIVSAGGTAAVLVGIPASTALGVAFGWPVVFGAVAAASIVVVGLALRLLPPVPGQSAAATVRMRDVVRLPGLARIVSVTALIMLGHFTFSTYVAPFLLHAGLSEAQVGPVLAGSGVVGLAGLTMTALLVDRKPRLAMLAGSASLSVAFLVLAVFGDSAVPAVVAGAATGLALGSLPTFLQTETLRAAPTAPEQASALNASAFNVGISGGALLGGTVLDHLGPAALPILSCTLTTAGLIVLTFHRPPSLAPTTAPV
jgi:MFS transporter, DHA1 family, inner membrane transport protein